MRSAKFVSINLLDFQSFCGVEVVLFLLLQNYFNRNLFELVNEIFNIEEIMG